MPEEQTVEEKQGLSTEQKTGFVLLFIFAITGLSLGFIQLRNTLLKPFALNNNIPSTLKDEVNDIDALRYRDTDNDGLNDYDELYINGTSPYLYDTFAYGFSDKEVVEKGLARCPNAGKNCADAGTPLSTSSTIAAELPDEGEGEEFLREVNNIENLLNDPAQIRQILIQNGMQKEVLDAISDAELLEMAMQISTSTLQTSQ